MYVNFRFGTSRRILRMRDGEFAVATWGPLCATLNQRSWCGRTDVGWTEYQPISRELALRFLALPAAQAAIRSNAAWDAWQEAVNETGFGPVASAVFAAVAG